MCGIILGTNIKKIVTKLSEQKDRGLDSLGILDINNNLYHKAIRKDIDGYKVFIRKKIKNKGIKILHHRKASVGEVNLDNGHPYKSADNSIFLIQNGTARSFFTDYKISCPGLGTDSAVLTEYLSWFGSLDKIKDELYGLSKAYDTDQFGIVIIVDENYNILIYSDGNRELSYKIRGGHLINLSNYGGDGKGKKFYGHILMDKNGKVLEEEMEEVKTIVADNTNNYINNTTIDEIFEDDIIDFFSGYSYPYTSYEKILPLFLKHFDCKSIEKYEIEYGVIFNEEYFKSFMDKYFKANSVADMYDDYYKLNGYYD